jgi:hypothetical protein
MRLRFALLAAVLALVAAPSAAAWPTAPELKHGPNVVPPAPVFDPLKSFKIELLGF